MAEEKCGGSEIIGFCQNLPQNLLRRTSGNMEMYILVSMAPLLLGLSHLCLSLSNGMEYRCMSG
jgi:hypothetical protein